MYTGSQNDSSKANTVTNLNPPTKKPQNVKPPPIYIDDKIDYLKLLDEFKSKYQNAFQAKFTFDKLKIMFANIKDFTEFKAICIRENIEFHTYILTSEKIIKCTLNVVLNQKLNPTPVYQNM